MENERPHIVNMISLGCVKNLVDTEEILAEFVGRGWLVAERARDADVILINTCGFIEDARSEAFEVIEGAVAEKNAGMVRGVVVMGCLVQYLRESLAEDFPEVDGWVGVSGPETVVDVCEEARAHGSMGAREKRKERKGQEGKGVAASRLIRLPEPSARALSPHARLRITPPHYAYLKIADGCDNRCAYCVIPSIRGPLRSKPEDQVVREAADLVADGERELLVIAQDTTNYGRDAAGESRLPGLLRKLRAVEGVEWLRVLYAHPAHFPPELISVLAEGRPLLPYIDLPIQHASDRILERMGRHVTQAAMRELIGRIRSALPDAVLRTTVIVGFPGERDEDFEELMGFVSEMRFERLGAFVYSPEEGTPAAGLDGAVPEEVKEERLEAVMELQKGIVAEQNEKLVGQELDGVVDGRGPDGEWRGRTWRDAPDVDGSVQFENGRLTAGTFGRMRITDAFGYDLRGEWLDEPAE